MIVRQLLRLADRARDLLGRRLVKDAVDIVVVIVDEQHPAAIEKLAQLLALGIAEAHGQMTGEIDERISQQSGDASETIAPVGVTCDLRVARDRVDDVRRDERRGVPVARNRTARWRR